MKWVIGLSIRSVLIMIIMVAGSAAQAILVDDFESAEGWESFSTEGVRLVISVESGYQGKCLRLDYEFTKGSGFFGIKKSWPIEMPENYRFSFYVRGESPDNNFETKLSDGSGENVWWVNRRGYSFPSEWTQLKVKKRHLSFAWGPNPRPYPERIGTIELTVASANGGRGSIWLDQLSFEPLPSTDSHPIEPRISLTQPPRPNPSPAESSSSSSPESIPATTDLSITTLTDHDPGTVWQSGRIKKCSLYLDLGRIREYGGLIIRWDDRNHARQFSLSTSQDSLVWDPVYSVDQGRGGTSYLALPEWESSRLRLELKESASGQGYGIREIEIKPIEWSATINSIFSSIAGENPRGWYPRYFLKEKSYWTVIGVNHDRKEALINEDGMVEIDKLSFSIEPFVYAHGRLQTWNNAPARQELEKGYLPIPRVIRSGNPELTIQAFASGEANRSSVLYINYRLKNTGTTTRKGHLYLAIRPFQVNPDYQQLNITGGATPIRSIEHRDREIEINHQKRVIPIDPDYRFGASAFDEGDIVRLAAVDQLPPAQAVQDRFGYASAAIRYDFDLAPGAQTSYTLAIPFYPDSARLSDAVPVETGSRSSTRDSVLVPPDRLPLLLGSTSPGSTEKLDSSLSLIADTPRGVEQELESTIRFWEEKVSHVVYHLPPSADPIIRTLKSNLAYILINRDQAGIQPGSRSYERSWIRDGSLTSSALLKNGIVDEVRDYIEWYSSYQFENGKIPCVVDRRGPDPVPENDSHGEFIYLIRTYFNYTHDSLFLRAYYPQVRKAVGYMEELISQRSTDRYRSTTNSLRMFYGLLPESISHEGYSAKPMHSYWDDFWGLRGLKDAAEMARILGDSVEARRIGMIRDTFRTNLMQSIQRSVARHGIDYIPGCAELGDFDATSTTIALYPVGETTHLPQSLLKNTFDRYYRFTEDRASDRIDWENYTPYEVRAIGSFILLNQPQRAHQLIDRFLKDQRPAGWNHWAEVVWRDPRLARFIGDMPHTWIGSDFINSIRMMFVYENEEETSLVIGAGLLPAWIDDPAGISLENLPTYYGDLSYSIRKLDDRRYRITLKGIPRIPAGGLVLKNFNAGRMPRQVEVNGQSLSGFTGDRITIAVCPAEIVITY